MNDITRLKFTDFAPDLELQTAGGDTLCLSLLWSEQPLLLVFTRHFGCPQCKELLDRLTQFRSEIEKAQISIAVVTQGAPAETKAFCAEYAKDLLCLADQERTTYKAYGLSRGTLAQTILSPHVWRANQKVHRRQGWKPELPPPGQDAFLMSGIFIIGTDGRIRLPYYYDNIADHPPIELLVHGVMGADWNKPFDGPISRK